MARRSEQRKVLIRMLKGKSCSGSGIKVALPRLFLTLCCLVLHCVDDLEQHFKLNDGTLLSSLSNEQIRTAYWRKVSDESDQEDSNSTQVAEDHKMMKLSKALWEYVWTKIMPVNTTDSCLEKLLTTGHYNTARMHEVLKATNKTDEALNLLIFFCYFDSVKAETSAQEVTADGASVSSSKRGRKSKSKGVFTLKTQTNMVLYVQMLTQVKQSRERANLEATTEDTSHGVGVAWTHYYTEISYALIARAKTLRDDEKARKNGRTPVNPCICLENNLVLTIKRAILNNGNPNNYKSK